MLAANEARWLQAQQSDQLGQADVLLRFEGFRITRAEALMRCERMSTALEPGLARARDVTGVDPAHRTGRRDVEVLRRGTAGKPTRGQRRPVCSEGQRKSACPCMLAPLVQPAWRITPSLRRESPEDSHRSGHALSREHLSDGDILASKSFERGDNAGKAGIALGCGVQHIAKHRADAHAACIAVDKQGNVAILVREQHTEVSVTAFVTLDAPGGGEARDADADLIGLRRSKAVQSADGADGVVCCDLDSLGHGAHPVLLASKAVCGCPMMNNLTAKS